MPKRLRRPRARLFIAFEGKSEISFGAWLQDLCDDTGLNVHLDRARSASGGDPLTLVQNVLDLQRRSKDKAGVGHRATCLLIDSDRLDDGTPRSRKAIAVAERKRIVLIRQRPCFEGMLLRLHGGHEQHWTGDPREAEQRLRHLWPGYSKPPTKMQLAARFQLSDLLRAADGDPDLARLLEVIGLK